MHKWFCKNNILPVLLSLLLFLTVMLTFWLGLLLFLTGHFQAVSDQRQTVSAPEHTLQEAVAEEVVRLHVIGDSNKKEDQDVKLKVKEAVVEYLQPLLTDATDKEAAMGIISGELAALAKLSSQVLQTEGFSYTADASLNVSYFPIKTYGDLVLPAGNYDALQIRLGSASGKNWWCLVFPRLCFVDVTYGTLPDSSKSELAALLTEEEFALLFPDKKKSTALPSEYKVKPVLRMKLLEWVFGWFD